MADGDERFVLEEALIPFRRLLRLPGASLPRCIAAIGKDGLPGDPPTVGD